MSLTIILKYIAVVAYCSILFFGGWTLWQLKIRKQKQSAVAIGFLNGGCVAVIVSIVLMVCGVRRELTEGGFDKNWIDPAIVQQAKESASAFHSISVPAPEE